MTTAQAMCLIGRVIVAQNSELTAFVVTHEIPSVERPVLGLRNDGCTPALWRGHAEPWVAV